MDKSKFNCVEHFPKILDLSHDKIINSFYQNRESITYSHKINGRWENQYLSIKYFPELRKLFRTACREGKEILEKSLVVPYKELGLPMDEFWYNIAGPGESTGWHDHKEKDQNYLEFIIFIFLIIQVIFILEKKLMLKLLNGK